MKGWIFTLAIFTVFSLSAQAQTPPKKLLLSDCISLALKQNPKIRNAQRQISVAGSGVTSARSTILPSLSGSASTLRINQGPRTFLQDVPVGRDSLGRIIYQQKEIVQNGYQRNSYNLGFSLNQILYDGGKWWNRIRQAKATYRSQEWNYRATRQDIILQVTQRYFELLKALQLQEVYNKSLESNREQYHKTQAMYEVGSVAQVDVYRAKVNLGQAQIKAINQKNQVLIAKSNLNVVLGRRPNLPLDIAQVEVPLEDFTGTLEDAKHIAVGHNPVLHSLEQQISANHFAIKVARGDYLPTISAQARYSRFNTLLDRVYSGWDKNYGWNMSLSVSWNFFNGFQREANLERQNLNYLISEENFRDQQRQLFQQVEQAYLNLQAYKQIFKINDENVKAAREDLRLAKERYRVGSGTLLEVIDAQVALTQSEATLVSTKYDDMIALVQLYNAMGILEKQITKMLHSN